MIENTIETTETFAERVNLLYQELEWAIRFDRPSILLAIYRSEFVRAEAEEALKGRLLDLGQKVQRVFINEENHDLPQYLREQANSANTVYFVSGIRFGGGKDGRNAYRALNIRREYFVDFRIRVVLWLTEQEAFNLPRYAPDFWVFRHRTVEFMDWPDINHIETHFENLIWREWQSVLSSLSPAFTEDTTAKIAYRERMLEDLPKIPEADIIRARLLYTLAPLYAAQKHNDKAISAYKQAIAMDPQDALSHNGLGNVYSQLGRTEDAIAAYQRAIELDPRFALPHNGLGNVYFQLGHLQAAVNAYQQAIGLDPMYATPHTGLGTVYAQLGRYDEAIAAYQQAIELDPQYAASHNGLGNVYADLGRYEEAIAEYQQAIALDPKAAAAHIGLSNVYAKLG